MKKISILIFVFILYTLISIAQPNLKTRVVVTDLDTPWEILWAPDNYIWVTERPGKVSRVNPGTGEIFEVITISDVREVGEGGLLGMVLDPDFQTNKYFYVAYNYYAAGNDYREKIVRFTFDTETGKADNPFILLDNIDGANNHNGCRMVITPDKKLILTTGDAQTTSNSQNIQNINGKTLRINLDGTIPDDNPFKSNPVWTWGHRNPQGLVFSPDGKILYSSEHGPSSNDEINIIQKGRNYGWPNVEGFCDLNNETAFCNDSNVAEPIYAWTPTLAVAGIDFYNSDLIPEWKNSLLVTSLKASRITQLLLNEAGTQVVKASDFYNGTFGRLRDICISPDGRVFIAVSNRDSRGTPRDGDDKIIEISPVSTFVPETASESKITAYPNPTSSVLQITFQDNEVENAIYSLYNSAGQVIKKGILKNKINTIVLPDDYEGVALLQIKLSDEIFKRKIVIKRQL